MGNDIGNATQAEQRRLAAIMFTDIVGFSRQMGADEARTLRLLAIHNQVIQQAVTAHKGVVIKTVGDAFLVDFPSVVNAVQCAQQIQAQFRAHNAEKEANEQIHVRIGIHLGDIVQQDGDVFGDGVNVASRLQGLAEPDTICISQKVYEEVEKKLALGTVISLGKPQAQEHCPAVRGLPSPARTAQGIAPTPPSATPEALSSGAPRAPHGGGWAVAHRRNNHSRPLFLSFRYSVLSTQSSVTQAAPAALPLPDKPSIVVLPFDNMSKDPEQDYFSDGITEDSTSDLSKISSLFVIARNSAFTYKGKAVKVQDVSREMGVRYVLEGSVRKPTSRCASPRS